MAYFKMKLIFSAFNNRPFPQPINLSLKLNPLYCCVMLLFRFQLRNSMSFSGKFLFDKDILESFVFK